MQFCAAISFKASNRKAALVCWNLYKTASAQLPLNSEGKHASFSYGILPVSDLGVVRVCVCVGGVQAVYVQNTNRREMHFL